MTVREALHGAIPALRAAGCHTPELDAQVMLADALEVDRAALVSDPAMELSPARGRVFAERVRRRLRREPVAYILGRQAFRHIELYVDPRVLIPRPETELLVEIAIEQPEGARVHDLGTGSGAIALAIKQERPDLNVSASDISREALAVAKLNAENLGVEIEFLPTANCQLPTDLTVANLPYVTQAEWQTLEPEITQHEPRGALVSGPDGLDAVRATLRDVSGRIALEHAPHQAEAVRALLDGAETHSDLARRERVTVGQPIVQPGE